MKTIAVNDVVTSGGSTEPPAARASSPRADRLSIALVAPPYFDVPPRGYGGVEAVVADLADGLVSRGHHVSLIGAGENGTTAEWVPVWAKTIPHRLGDPHAEVVHAAATRSAVARLLRQGGVDVVHDNTLAGPLNASAYEAMGVATVVTAHWPMNDDLRRLYDALREDIHLVAISHRQRELAPELRWAGTVHNAVRVATFPFLADKADYALFLGRFHPEKAPHLALEAAHAAGLPLILAGKCSEPIELEYYDREVRPRLADGDRVVGVADASAKRALLKSARCLLFPVQWEEPFGMVMIEAMACGTPVVALRGGAVAEVVADGVTGYVCDDPRELPTALRDVDGIDRQACRQRVEDFFDAAAMVDAYEATYRAAIASIRPAERRPRTCVPPKMMDSRAFI